jgi:hypothetical protein
MGVVMIKCPKTGRDISTGITADRVRFNSTPVFFAHTYCPICRATHEWFAKDAWVREPHAKAPHPMHHVPLSPIASDGVAEPADA